LGKLDAAVCRGRPGVLPANVDERPQEKPAFVHDWRAGAAASRRRVERLGVLRVLCVERRTVTESSGTGHWENSRGIRRPLEHLRTPLVLVRLVHTHVIGQERLVFCFVFLRACALALGIPAERLPAAVVK